MCKNHDENTTIIINNNERLNSDVQVIKYANKYRQLVKKMVKYSLQKNLLT